MSEKSPTAREGEHRLMVRLRQCGLPTHVADQVVAEVEDSLWLAEHDERILKEATPKDVPHVRAEALREAAEIVGRLEGRFGSYWEILRLAESVEAGAPKP